MESIVSLPVIQLRCNFVYVNALDVEDDMDASARVCVVVATNKLRNSVSDLRSRPDQLYKILVC